VSHWLAAKRSTRTLSSAPEVQQNTGSPEQWQHIIATFEGEIAWLNRQIKENGARLLLVFIPSEMR
jgi:hypothetical protein